MWTLIYIAIAVVVLIVGFVIAARKGRQLRKQQPLPPKVKEAFLQWDEEGENTKMQIESPFYFGRSEDCDVILPSAKQEFEACIFEHRDRFAIQTLDGADIVSVNGHELQAGYLWDGDHLKVAGQNFTFHCF